MRQDGRRGGERGPIGRVQAIDELDRKLMEALQKSGRESFRNIARQLDVSEATIRNRYQRLVNDNLLQVTGITNPLGVGFDSMAMIGVNTNGPTEPVAEVIAGWKEVSYVVITMGRFDLLVEVVCVDRQQLHSVTDRIRSLESVVATETFGYLDLVKQVVDWGVPMRGSSRDGPQ
jgi:Lrp/AsnC family transcriptional regulator, regulator for asnA, asnC and gidA